MKAYDAFSPHQMPILGTLDTVKTIAEVNNFQFAPDTLTSGLMCEWLGETKVFWDGQITQKADCGCDLYLDENGNEWPECQLLFREEGNEQAPLLRIWEAKHDARCDAED